MLTPVTPVTTLKATRTAVKTSIWREKGDAKGVSSDTAQGDWLGNIRKAAAIKPKIAPDAPTTGTGLAQLNAR